jgi:hypothetical protein
MTPPASSNGHFAVTIAGSTNHPDSLDDALPPSSGNNSNRLDDDDELVDPDDPFDITQTKNASHDTLRRWRVITAFLTSILCIYQFASLRFMNHKLMCIFKVFISIFCCNMKCYFKV